MPPCGGTRHLLVEPSAEAIDQVSGHAVKVQIGPYCSLSVCAIIRDKPTSGGLELVIPELYFSVVANVSNSFIIAVFFPFPVGDCSSVAHAKSAQIEILVVCHCAD